MKRCLLYIVGLVVLPACSLFAQSEAELFQQALKFFGQEDYLRAAERLELYLEERPFSKSAYRNLESCYYLLGDREHFCATAERARQKKVFVNARRRTYFCDRAYRAMRLKPFYYPKKEIYPERDFRPVYIRADSLRGALRPQRSCYDVDYYDLSVELDMSRKRIIGSTGIYFTALEAESEIQIDLFEQFEIDRIEMDGVFLRYRREYGAVFIEMPEVLAVGRRYQFRVYYSGKPNEAARPPWQGGFVWSRDKRMNRWVGVACEHHGASSWWPVKDHLSDRPDSMSIRITVPKRFDAISNGSFRGTDTLSDNRLRYNWFVSYPINSYNATFYVGKYSDFHDRIPVSGGSTLEAWYHVLPAHVDKAKEHFRQAREVLAYYTEAFGPFPYPKDKFRMVESPYEGMEHQTAIAYGSAYNNEKNSRTYVNKDYDYIIVHEAAHEWWGNSVTIADMADVWLHEGFATYAEYLFLEEVLGYEESIKEMVHHLPEINNIWPMVHNRHVNEDAFAGQDVYLKGAQLLNALRATINNDTLFKGMLRAFYNAYQYQIITTSDFIDFVHRYTGEDYAALFNVYLYGIEPPLFAYSYERTQEGLVLHYTWRNVEAGFHMPLSIATFGEEKAYRLEATTDVQELLLPGAESFRFFNGLGSMEDCPHNGFSYYYTAQVDNL